MLITEKYFGLGKSTWLRFKKSHEEALLIDLGQTKFSFYFAVSLLLLLKKKVIHNCILN